MQFALNKLRNAARVLLTLDEKDPKRIFEGEAIMRRMYRYGLLVRLHNRDPKPKRRASRASRSARSVGDEPRPATPLTRVQTGKVTLKLDSGR